MVNYVYEVSWNECDEKDTFPTFPEAKDFINQKTATGNPNYVSPFIYEIELAEDENGMFVPTGNDVCVFSWDNQTGQPDIRQPKLFDDSEYEDADFEIYDVFDTEKEPEPAEPDVDPYDGRNLFNFDEALSALNEADEAFGECQCCHEEFPKEELVKEGSRFICKECAGNLTEALKIISDISEYKPWSGAVATWDKIEAANKVDDLEALLEDAYPDGLTMTELNDILWFDPEWILEALGLDTDVEESLEDTVPEDLADDRTPKQGNVFKLEQPVDYKKEIAKEKLVDEELHEDVELTEAPLDGKNRLAKYLKQKGAKIRVSQQAGGKQSVEVDDLKQAEAKAKQLSSGNVPTVITILKNDAAGVAQDINAAIWNNGKQTKSDYNSLKGIFKGGKAADKAAANNTNNQQENQATNDEAQLGAVTLNAKGTDGQPIEIQSGEDIRANVITEDDLKQIVANLQQMLSKFTNNNIKLDNDQLSKFAQLIRGSMETTFGKDIFLDNKEVQAKEQEINNAAEAGTNNEEEHAKEASMVEKEKEDAAKATDDAGTEEGTNEKSTDDAAATTADTSAGAENNKEATDENSSKEASTDTVTNAGAEAGEEAGKQQVASGEEPAGKEEATGGEEASGKEEASSGEQAAGKEEPKAESLKVSGNMLHEDLAQDIKKWNEYVKYLQAKIAEEEKALEKAGENELVKKAIQRRIDAFKADLEEALPNIVKTSEAEISEVSDAEEKPVEESKKNKKLKESYNQDEFKRYMAAAEKLGIKTGADMIKFSEEHGGVKDKALLDAMEAEANKQE